MNKMKKLAALCLSFLLVLAMFSLSVFAEDAVEEEAKHMSTFALVSLIVGGVVLVLLVVLCIVKRKKLVESLRAYKSEMKKITWYPWKQVWRGTVLVIVVVLVTAAAIGLLDFAFFEGQFLLTGKGIQMPW